MDNKFDDDKKISPKYIYGDLAVSLLLFSALKYADSLPIFSTWAIVGVTVCFFVYSHELDYEFKFYKSLVVITAICAIITTIIINLEILINLQVYIYSIFLAIVLIQYSKHILAQKKTYNKKDN